MQTVAMVLSPLVRAVERRFYPYHLLLGGPHDPTVGHQGILASAFDDTLEMDDWELTPPRGESP